MKTTVILIAAISLATIEPALAQTRSITEWLSDQPASAEQTPLDPWQRFEQTAPLGKVEVRPMPPDCKPPPVWNGYFGDDTYGNHHPNGSAPPGWLHPSVRVK